MSATVTPIPNPDFMSNPEVFYDKCVFHSRVFRVSEVAGLDEQEDYDKLMSSMHPFRPESNLMLNPTGSPITKTWTKEGDLLIHVEWIEMIVEEEKRGVDNREF